MGHRRPANGRPAMAFALAAGLLASGCSLLFGEVDRSECQADDDCPPGEICEGRARCAAGSRPPDTGPDPEPDRGLDAAVDMMPDAERDAAVELDAEIDLGPDADPATLPFGPTGDCFAGLEAGEFTPSEPPTGALHVPRAACTPYARLWTARAVDGSIELAWDTDADGISEGRVPLDGTYAVGGGSIFAPRRRAAEDGLGRRQLVRVDPATGDEAPVRVGPFDQRGPVYGQRRIAFVESGGDAPSGVVVIEEREPPESPRELECAAAGAAQWGPALGPGFVAWFEQPLGSRRTRVVVIERRSCEVGAARRVQVLDGAVDREARLWAVDGAVVWLEPEPGGGGNRIRRWRFGDPAARVESLYLEDRALRVDPAEPPDTGANPIELSADGHRLAVVSYRAVGRLRYVLHRVDLDAAPSAAVTRVELETDARAPWVSQSYLLWAEPDRLGDWRVAYERLD